MKSTKNHDEFDDKHKRLFLLFKLFKKYLFKAKKKKKFVKYMGIKCVRTE